MLFFIIEYFCNSNEFYCPSGKCVLMKDTCNGRWDCYDGSDEPGVCEKSSSGMTGKKKKVTCFQTIKTYYAL